MCTRCGTDFDSDSDIDCDRYLQGQLACVPSNSPLARSSAQLPVHHNSQCNKTCTQIAATILYCCNF